ncbi:MAG: hypothetical protein V3S98_10300 [Dehalococcoidia bacterium]
MTEEMTKWEPTKFDGSDLLPCVALSNDLEVVGNENIDDEDTILPTIQMLQGTAVNNVKGSVAGQFYNTVTKELVDGPIRVLTIAHSKGASFFPPEGSDIKPCWSLDGIEGNEYGDCIECGRSSWDRSTDPHTKPTCNKQHKLIVMTPSGPALMRFQSSSYKALEGMFSAKQALNKNFFDHPLIITADGPHEVKRPGGKKFTYYKMDAKWDTTEPVPLEIRKMALETYKGLRDAQSHGRLKGSDEGESADIPF